jgi:hypothetical protein
MEAICNAQKHCTCLAYACELLHGCLRHRRHCHSHPHSPKPRGRRSSIRGREPLQNVHSHRTGVCRVISCLRCTSLCPSTIIGHAHASRLTIPAICFDFRGYLKLSSTDPRRTSSCYSWRQTCCNQDRRWKVEDGTSDMLCEER